MPLLPQAPPTPYPARHRDALAVRLEHVHRQFGQGPTALRAVQDVSLDVARGEFVSLVGPSGCGKSTLLRIIGGLLPPTDGAVGVLGDRPARAQRQKRIGFVFQEPALLPWRSVRDNVRLPLEVNRRPADPPASTVDGLLELVGLAAFRDYRPHALSGGMQQRVALARALALGPSLLLMDEPLASLDEITREQMRYELLRIRDQAGQTADGAGITVIMVTHSVPEAVALSDRVLVMSRRPGRLLADLPVPLPRPRTEAMERSPAFLDVVDRVRALLRGEPAP